ncbi:MAG: hypothetical protein LPK02_01755, partial [Rhodobacterales bacterium]|nr:hypothetical protein [Rhodobacterales bacterium]MDX5411756.1 hypothetical protein [Rhodobacterales bacterium]
TTEAARGRAATRTPAPDHACMETQTWLERRSALRADSARGRWMSEDAWRDRMERKLDSMAEAIVVLARVEERLVTMFKRMDAYDTKQAEISRKVNTLENSVGNNGQMLRFAERVFWIVVTAGVAFAFTTLKG